MRLTWHDYRYYPYERELANRESSTLLPGARLEEARGGFELTGKFALDKIQRLTYFSGLQNGRSFCPTIQRRLEDTASSGKTRQNTRYSVHGLHEYKGKFNPQVAKALLNIFKMYPGSKVFDPFCGSGTTLVECSQLGIESFGIDLNPLAVYIANAKLLALETRATELRSALACIADGFHNVDSPAISMADNPRNRYLADWFDLPVLNNLEAMRDCIASATGPLAPVFLTIASNLLRGYSRQDPHDLRIRRRKSPLPDTPMVKAFLEAATHSLSRIEAAQSELDGDMNFGAARVCDATSLTRQDIPGPFDAAITSPPYAMALPYIDTHRLSLVWLELIDAGSIRELESELVGSREIRGESRQKLLADLATNAAQLPAGEADFCAMLQDALGPADGFRRKAVPSLLYRYFSAMRDSLAEIRQVMKLGAPFGLIVGQNHTILGGVRYTINTPAHIVNLAENVGWSIADILALQTYQRYGYHMNNAISAESLLILRA